MRRVAKYQIVEFKTGERVWNTTVYNNLKDLIKGMKKTIDKREFEFDIDFFSPKGSHCGILACLCLPNVS